MSGMSGGGTGDKIQVQETPAAQLARIQAELQSALANPSKYTPEQVNELNGQAYALGIQINLQHQVQDLREVVGTVKSAFSRLHQIFTGVIKNGTSDARNKAQEIYDDLIENLIAQKVVGEPSSLKERSWHVALGAIGGYITAGCLLSFSLPDNLERSGHPLLGVAVKILGYAVMSIGPAHAGWNAYVINRDLKNSAILSPPPNPK